MNGFQFFVVGFLIGMGFILIRDICLCACKIPARYFVISMYLSYALLGGVISAALGLLWNFNKVFP